MRRYAIVAALALAVTAPAHATVVSFVNNATVGGNSVSATASFTISGGSLTIVLQNTSAANSLEAPTNTLSGVSFDLPGDPLLTPVSAFATSSLGGQAIIDQAACSLGVCAGTSVNVGGEFGYQKNFGGHEAIGSAGYITTGLAHDLGNLGGSDLDSHASLGGIDFGIVSKNHGAFNGGLNGRALVEDTVTFTFTGLGTLTESDISNISFLYGTSPDATVGGSTPSHNPPPPIPEPATILLLGLGLAGLIAARRARV